MVTLSAGMRVLYVSFHPSTEIDVEYYLIHASQTQGFSPSESNLINRGPETSVSVPLTQSGTWYVRVAAVDSFGEDALTYSNEYSIAVPDFGYLDTTPPAIPNAPLLTTGLITGGPQITSYITASWDASVAPDIAGYVVQFQDVAATYPEEYNTDTVIMKFEGLLSNTYYKARVAAVDKYSNRSEFSAWATLSTNRDSEAPATPAGFTMSSGIRTVICNWLAVTDPDLKEYCLHLSTTPGFTPGDANLVWRGVATAYSFSAVPSTTYYGKVVAVDFSGNLSAPTAQATATTGQVVDVDIMAAAIKKTHISDNAVDTPQLNALAITAGKIAAGAVETDKLSAGAVTADKVTTGELLTLSAQIKDAIISSAKIISLAANKITTGVLDATSYITVGMEATKAIILSGVNKNITVFDGNVNRVVIGKLPNNDWGIDVKNNVGQSLFTTSGDIDGVRVSNLVATGNLTTQGTLTIGDTTISTRDLVDQGMTNRLGFDTPISVSRAITITGDSDPTYGNGYINSGKLNWNDMTNPGFYLGYKGSNSTDQAFHIGKDSSQYLMYDSAAGLKMVGGSIQTTDTAGRGVKIDSTGLKAYAADGTLKSSIDAATGKAEFSDVKVRGDIEATSLGATCPVKTANIETAAVDTLQIAGQAVTFPQIDEASSSYVRSNLYSNTWYDTDISVSVTIATGQTYPVIILANIEATEVSSGVSCVCRVVRVKNSVTTQIGPTVTVLVGASGSIRMGDFAAAVNTPRTLNLQDTPGEGTSIYTLQMTTNANPGGATLTVRSLLVMEAKR